MAKKKQQNDGNNKKSDAHHKNEPKDFKDMIFERFCEWVSANNKH